MHQAQHTDDRMNAIDAQLMILAQAWIAYFLLHSLLASLGVKRWVARLRPDWMPAYRLFFNALAVLLLIPILWLTFAYRGPPLWQWQGIWSWIVNGISVLALAGFVWSLRFYDSGEFIGLRQWRDNRRKVEDQERLHISPLHRYVRHPWYFLGLLLIWTRDMDPALLLGATFITLYFIVGSRLEERKLLEYHGEAYRRYMARVAGLLPLPWRRLARHEAAELEALSRDSRH
jgi:protein-S-isoprenylcysteine O-methyltransferase Ste14